ncbi:MAG: hypothetical protein ACLQBX_13045 [Candidatus Limnocylindrales bacterium]
MGQRRVAGWDPGPDTALDTADADTMPTLHLVPGMPPNERDWPPAVRRACRYRAAAARVPAGTRVRLPACPRCGRRLGYRETADGALFLHVHDPAFRLRVVGKTR